ncbi:CS-domain containing protein, conserved in, putative [Plasmodium gallinaceum]|uniref:NudC domain-containing protein 1 n=1 Tax=Plasmodium gallinaceum TaxID=5849 RepID=A0A1J1GWQ6_PLAGA|nr:CS-domain containing protein, conserved in, putative [Plasmodium gallinaceum]CRG96749.1 CS-domain containing protein, conserved in, putative [Plasmodium gallinaceum]
MTKWLLILIIIINCVKYIDTLRIKRNLILILKRGKKKGKVYSRCFINNFLQAEKKKRNSQFFRIYRGFGTTCSYEWIESDDNLEIKIRLSPNVSPDDIQYRLKCDYIYVKLKNKPKSAIEGRLKGNVDVNLSTWFLEKFDDYSVLNIFLKKKDRGINEWVGVVEKENILHVSYENSPDTHKHSNTSSQKKLDANMLLYTQYFENAKQEDIYEFLLKWASKKAINPNDFGIPTTKLKTSVMHNEHGLEIIISGYDLKWEAEDSLLLKLSSFEKGIELNVYRGNIASGIKGLHGNMISYLVQDCEERILKKLQHDLKGVFYLNPLSKKIEKLMHEQSPQRSYNYILSEDNKKHISLNDENTNISNVDANETSNSENKKDKEENENEKKKKEIKINSEDEEIIIKELNLNSKVKLTCDDKNKEPEFMKEWSEEKKIEFRRNSVLELKKNLELSQENKLTLKLKDYIDHMKLSFDLTEEESKLIWKKGILKSDEQKNREKFYKFTEIENLTDKINMYNMDETNADEFSYSYIKEENNNSHEKNYNNKMEKLTNKEDEENSEENDSNRELTTNEEKKEDNSYIDLSPNVKSENINKRFFNCLEDQLLSSNEENKLTLYDIYMKSNDNEKKQMREKWRINELRLNTLIEELKYLDNDIIPTVCNNYREVLLSDEYPCLMKLRLQENPPKTVEEKKILRIVNSFVISLYDDIKIVMEHEEKEHLKKIQLICEKAIEDEKGLNDFIESMKPLLDYSFLGYIKHAINVEKKNIQLQNKDFRENPSDWLIILMIIQKGIYSILEKDIWEDVIHISSIICHDHPGVRQTILKTMVASMPKADWIFFKDIIKTLYKSVQEKKLTANHFPDFPHIPEAIFQLNYDIEKILPDWFIKEMLDEYDKSVIEQMKLKKPLFWKMKETKWDQKFVQDFKRLQIEKYKQYENKKAKQ